MRLIDDAWQNFKTLWTIRVAAFWGAICGLFLVWPALTESMPKWAYASGGILICVSIAVARFLKQPGTDF